MNSRLANFQRSSGQPLEFLKRCCAVPSEHARVASVLPVVVEEVLPSIRNSSSAEKNPSAEQFQYCSMYRPPPFDFNKCEFEPSCSASHCGTVARIRAMGRAFVPGGRRTSTS